jgi:hypothetical protein
MMLTLLGGSDTTPYTSGSADSPRSNERLNQMIKSEYHSRWRTNEPSADSIFGGPAELAFGLVKNKFQAAARAFDYQLRQNRQIVSPFKI